MDPSLSTAGGRASLPAAGNSRLHVKNTFLEVEGDSDDSLEMEDSWMRASTEPAKVVSFARPSQSRLASPESGMTMDGFSHHMRDGLQAHKEPQYVYPQPQASTDLPGREDGLRALERDPELAPVFESIKNGGAESAMQYLRDPGLMQKISRKMDELKVPALQRPLPAELSGLARTMPSMEENVVEQMTLNSIRNMTCSVTLGDPSLDDCPLIACSEGFESLTGYSQREVIGRNCRFLNAGVSMDPTMRCALRDAVNLGRAFVGVLPNLRKNGERFSNLLRLMTTTVRGKTYIIGVQADVSDIDLDLGNPVHLEELQTAARHIFSSNIDAWVQMQARQFFIRQPAPQQFQEAQGKRVVTDLAGGGGRLQGSSEPARATRATRAARAAAPGKEPASLSSSPVQADGQLPNSEQSTYAASVVGGDPSEESADGSRMPAVHGPLRSLGSAGHPDNCSAECIFYFFRDGCRAGENCKFCHEFHRRKNMKKNRRILRRLCSEAGGTTENDDPGQPPAPSTAGDAGPAAAEAQAPRVPPREGPPVFGTVRYWYGKEALPAGAAAQGLTLLAGQRVDVPANLEVSPEELRSCLRFSVEPALPAGLTWDAATGRIGGAPAAAQAPATYLFTASTAATGPGGIDLGQVHLATVRLSIGVADPRRLALSWGHCGADGTSLILKLQATD